MPIRGARNESIRLLNIAIAVTKGKRSVPKGPPGRRGRKDGGEPVAVNPDRPRQGAGGASAALEFDRP